MKHEDAISFETRLFAVEHILIHALNLLYQTLQASEELIQRVEAHHLKELSEQSFSGVDPVFSDHMSDEIVQAVQALFEDAAELRGVDRKN